MISTKHLSLAMVIAAVTPPAKAGATAGLIGATALLGRRLIGSLLDRAPPWIS